MSDDLTNQTVMNDRDKLDLILTTIHRLQEELLLTKCDIQRSIRDVSIKQNVLMDSDMRLSSAVKEFNERLHGMELIQQRQNSST